MYTPPEVVATITSAVRARFARDNGIEPTHLEPGSTELTSVEALRAYQGAGLIEDQS